MKQRWLMMVVVFQVAWIVGLSAMHELRLANGQRVVLKTAPVDPRDLLRGDYVILGYEISRLGSQLFLGETPGAGVSGEVTVYVALEKRGKFHEAVRASFRPIGAGAGEVVMKGKGRASGNGDRPWNVRYGLEQYFVREGTGNPVGELTVIARVGQEGNASIEDVLVNGVPYREAMRLQAP